MDKFSEFSSKKNEDNSINVDNIELDNIELNEEELNEAEEPSTKFKYEITANLAKLRKTQKYLIDAIQLMAEMQVDIQKLKINAKRLKKNAPPVVDEIQENLQKMILKIKDETKDGNPNHAMFFSEKVRAGLEELQELKYKEDFES